MVVKETRKIRYQNFLALSNFTGFIYFVTNILSGIVVSNLMESDPAFCLLIMWSYLNLPPIPQILSAARILGIGRNF